MKTPEDEKPAVTGPIELRFGLVLPTLLPPQKGAFEDTSDAYGINPETFRIAMQYRLETENPALLRFFEDDVPTINPERAFRWLYVYYGMFERAARNQNMLPLNVTDRTARSYVAIQVLRDDNDDLPSDEVIGQVEAEWQRRRERDRAFSPELAKFWDGVEADIKTAEAEGESENLYFCRSFAGYRCSGAFTKPTGQIYIGWCLFASLTFWGI